jgi:hypothetical protein
VNWILPIQEKAQWRVLVNTVINFGIPQNNGGLFDQLSDYQLLKDCAQCYLWDYQNFGDLNTKSRAFAGVFIESMLLQNLYELG